ncbi:hypothetical protein [Methanopyrus sp.]
MKAGVKAVLRPLETADEPFIEVTLDLLTGALSCTCSSSKSAVRRRTTRDRT